MYQGDADEVIVAIKLVADEGMVTYQRVKPRESDTDVRGEGRNKESVILTITTHRNLKVWLRSILPWSGTPYVSPRARIDQLNSTMHKKEPWNSMSYLN